MSHRGRYHQASSNATSAAAPTVYDALPRQFIPLPPGATVQRVLPTPATTATHDAYLPDPIDGGDGLFAVPNNAVPAFPPWGSADPSDIPGVYPTYDDGTMISDPAASQAFVTVVDPQTHKLKIPVHAVIPTMACQAFYTKVRVPSLCMLYEFNTCRQGHHCHQVHCDPEVLFHCREYEPLSCCAAHGDPAIMIPGIDLHAFLPDETIATIKYVVVADDATARGSHQHPENAARTVVPIGTIIDHCRMSMTVGLYKIIAHLATAIDRSSLLPHPSPTHYHHHYNHQHHHLRRAASRSTSATIAFAPAGTTPVDPADVFSRVQQFDWTSPIPIRKGVICRLHQAGRCRSSDDCNFVHVCRELTAHAAAALPQQQYHRHQFQSHLSGGLASVMPTTASGLAAAHRHPASLPSHVSLLGGPNDFLHSTPTDSCNTPPTTTTVGGRGFATDSPGSDTSVPKASRVFGIPALNTTQDTPSYGGSGVSSAKQASLTASPNAAGPAAATDGTGAGIAGSRIVLPSSATPIDPLYAESPTTVPEGSRQNLFLATHGSMSMNSAMAASLPAGARLPSGASASSLFAPRALSPTEAGSLPPPQYGSHASLPAFDDICQATESWDVRPAGAVVPSASSATTEAASGSAALRGMASSPISIAATTTMSQSSSRRQHNPYQY